MGSGWRADDYGKSDYTPTKQEHLRQIATMVMCAAREVRKKHTYYSDVFLCADLFAGPGCDEDGDEGSPLVLLQAAEEHLGAGVRFEFFEKDGDRAARLHAHTAFALQRFTDASLRVTACDCQDGFRSAIQQMRQEGLRLRHMLGLVYVDPTSLIPWPLLQEIAQQLPRVDIVISMPATTLKRVRGAFDGRNDPRLCDALTTIEKTRWFIRSLIGRHQWTLLLGTNYANMRTLHRIRMVDCATDAGKRVLRQASYTHGELDGGSHPLPLF